MLFYEKLIFFCTCIKISFLNYPFYQILRPEFCVNPILFVFVFILMFFYWMSSFLFCFQLFLSQIVVLLGKGEITDWFWILMTPPSALSHNLVRCHCWKVEFLIVGDAKEELKSTYMAEMFPDFSFLFWKFQIVNCYENFSAVKRE